MSSLVVCFIVSCSTSFTALVPLLLQTFWKWPILLHSMHIFPYTRHCLGGCVLPQYLQVCLNGVLDYIGPLGLSMWAYLATQILSNSFVSVMALITAAWVLCASILFAHDKIFSLVMVSFPFIVVNAFIISPNISLSLSPCMNCSFNCLSSSL